MKEIMTVSEADDQGHRVLLYSDSIPDYHVVAPSDCKIKVGDIIEYKPEGANFGWFIGLCHYAYDTYSLIEDVLIVTIFKQQDNPKLFRVIEIMKKCGYDKSSDSVAYHIEHCLHKVNKLTDLHEAATEEDIRKAEIRAKNMLKDKI